MIMDKARELGIALSETEEFRLMADAREAFENDECSINLLNQYNQAQDLIVTLLETEDVDPGQITALSQDLERLQGELTALPAFSEMMRAQKQFQELVQKVNRVVGECIGATESTELSFSTGCGGGSCASCSGCKH